MNTQPSERMHTWWSLSYASYLTIPRVIIQSMPEYWQESFLCCLEELDEQLTKHKIQWPPEGYGVDVLLTLSENDYAVKYKDDYADYQRGRRRLWEPASDEVYFQQSRNIGSYRQILDDLVEDFGPSVVHTMMVWCGLLTDTVHPNKYWQVYAVETNNQSIGICGLYSLDERETVLWLGWFGILKSHRNLGLGNKILDKLLLTKLPYNCKKVYSYVPSHGKPLPFYERFGFKRVSTVAEFLEANPGHDKSDFGGLDDHVICLDVLEWAKNRQKKS